MYTIIEALADGSVKQGVPRQMAIQFAAQTLLGAAKTVLQTGKHPAVLRDEVRKRRKIIFLSTTDICRETQSTNCINILRTLSAFLKRIFIRIAWRVRVLAQIF